MVEVNKVYATDPTEVIIRSALQVNTRLYTHAQSLLFTICTHFHNKYLYGRIVRL